MKTLSNDYINFFKNFRAKYNLANDVPLFDFVIITGDLHDSSGVLDNNIDYTHSIEFLDALIKDTIKVDKENVYIVPGNHDAEYYPLKDNNGNVITKTDKSGNIQIKYDTEKRAKFENYARFLNAFFCNDCSNRDTKNCKGNNCNRHKYKIWAKNQVDAQGKEQDNTQFNGPLIVKWSEKIGQDVGSSISILHLNTVAWYRDKTDNSFRTSVIDTINSSLDNIDIEEGAPVIAIGHNPFPYLESNSQSWLVKQIQKSNISVYLCGDVHQRDLYDISGTDIKSISCSKLSSDKRDGNWSDFGFIIYEWNHNDNNMENNNDGKITVYPLTWDVYPVKDNNGKIIDIRPARCGIQLSPYFRVKKSKDDLYGEDLYFMLKHHGKPNGLDNKCEQYVIGSKPDGYHKAIFGKIHDILTDKKIYKPNVLVIGDVMLDFIDICKKTSTGQSQSHDVQNDFTLNGSANEKTNMGGAANVATSFKEVSKSVKLFGVIGSDKNDIFGKTLQDLTTKQLGKANNHIFPMKNYKTITKIYLKEEINNRKSTFARINRELKGRVGWTAINAKDNNNDEVCTKFIDTFKEELQNVDVIVLKDHEKGLLNFLENNDDEYSNSFAMKIIDAINAECETRNNNKRKNNDQKLQQLIIILDPKYNWNIFNKLDHIDAILPNVKEMAAMLYPNDNQKDIWSDREAVCRLYSPDRKILFDTEKWWNKSDKVGCIAITEGKNGVSFYRPNEIQNEDIQDFELSIPGIPISNQDYISEIGAGDTFDAYFTSCIFHKKYIMNICNLQKEKEFYECALKLANFAAARSCTSEPSTPYTIENLKTDIGA